MAYQLVDYVWIGGNNELRSKTRVLYHQVNTVEDVPEWNYDGSSTDQADADTSEIFIRPRRLFNCPFRPENGFLVMCDTYTCDDQPAKNNYRATAAKVFEEYADQKPWYGLEQEYFIYDRKTDNPLGYHVNGTQGQYYCSVGSLNSFGRNIVEHHMQACLHAGIHLSGINAEVAPGQFEFQIGPVEGIDAADQLWMARYIYEKISELYDVYIVYEPKPLKGDWNGSGCHTNFSTLPMREENGYRVIIDAMDKLSEKHTEHMLIYGDDNHTRMSGLHETSSYDEFTYGIANRKCSVRIPTETFIAQKGYFEDRRPAANIDPYRVTAKILETINN